MRTRRETIGRNIIFVGAILIALSLFMLLRNRVKEEEINVKLVGTYNVDIIKQTYKNAKNNNYLISPYNIEIALNMLREGANGNTKDEIDKVIGKRKINDISIKDKLSIANAVFIKDDYKDNVKKDFINVLKNNYQADILYDKFINPDVINNWVNEKTNNMIPKLLDKMDKDYVMGLASALAMDVEWVNSFECDSTREEEFINGNSKLKVEMMHQTYEGAAKYIKNDEVEGIELPYITDENTDLSFIALLPKDGVNNYISNLTIDKLNGNYEEKVASNKLHINLSLPRFSYDYNVDDFIEVLKDMGINTSFDKYLADFKKMVELENENVYVGEAIHKTRIELGEKGTKAAAVTYFGMFKATGMIERDYEEININFNKPFVYMIKENKTGEILFFGTVFEPNTWKGTTCSNQE